MLHRLANGMWLPFIIGAALLLVPTAARANAANRWLEAALQGVRDSKMGAPMVSRALAVVHTCMFDAWAAYDEKAIGTQLRGALRRPSVERTLANKERAISYVNPSTSR